MGGVNCQAQTVTTATDDQTDVTIVTTAENQIGVKKTDDWGNVSYDFASGLSEADKTLLTNATKLTIKGNVSNIDMMVLFNKQPQTTNTNTQLTYLDLSEATFSQFDIVKDGDGYHWTFMPNGYTHWNGVTYLSLPKPCEGQTELPGYPLSEDGTVASYTNFKAVFGGLKTVIIPEGYTSIGTHAFDGCNLTSVTLPQGLTEIKDFAFAENTTLRSIEFPESLEKIGAQAFMRNDFKVLLFPQNVKYLGDLAFGQMVSGELSDVYFQGLESPECGDGVFEGGAYAGYSGFTNPSTTNNGVTRANYVNGSKWFCILHFRPDLTADQQKTYWDKTRKFTYNDLYLGEERKWPTHEEFVQAHSRIYYYNGTTDSKGTGTPSHFDGTALDETELKHIGILRFVLTRADAPIPEDGPEINDDNWWTICLPYTLTEAEVKEAFGENTQLYALEKITRDYDKEEILLSFTFNIFGDEDRKNTFGGDQYYGTTIKHGQLTAWIPYMIKPSKQLDTTEEGAKYLTFGTRLPESGSEVTDFVKATINGTQTDATDPSDSKALTWYYAFRGNCSGTYKTSEGEAAGTVYHRPNYCYFLGGKKNSSTGKIDVSFYWQNNIAGKVWTPYTCVTLPILHKEGTTASETVGVDDTFYGADGKPSASAKRTSSFFGEDGSTTAIENVRIVTPDQAANGNIYNMSGQLVRANALTTDGLAKGIYICNGKKFVVK